MTENSLVVKVDQAGNYTLKATDKINAEMIFIKPALTAEEAKAAHADKSATHVKSVTLQLDQINLKTDSVYLIRAEKSNYVELGINRYADEKKIGVPIASVIYAFDSNTTDIIAVKASANEKPVLIKPTDKAIPSQSQFSDNPFGPDVNTRPAKTTPVLENAIKEAIMQSAHKQASAEISHSPFELLLPQNKAVRGKLA